MSAHKQHIVLVSASHPPAPLLTVPASPKASLHPHQNSWLLKYHLQSKSNANGCISRQQQNLSVRYAWIESKTELICLVVMLTATNVYHNGSATQLVVPTVDAKSLHSPAKVESTKSSLVNSNMSQPLMKCWTGYVTGAIILRKGT